MKVSVDAKALYNLYDVLNSMKASQSNIIKIARDMVSDMLPVLDVDGTAIEKHDDSQIPVRSKEANIQAIKEALAKEPDDRKNDDDEIRRLRKLAYEKRPAPDPRCDGCEHQHPYAENLSYDIAAGKVYCNRGVTPTYYKEGRTIRYPPNLMICDMYYLNNGKLAKFGTEWNPPCAQYCIPEMEKLIEREVSNQKAIIEILNILDSSSCSRGWNRTTVLRNKINTLRTKMEK